MRQNRFRIAGYRSTLFLNPGQEAYELELPIEGYSPGAGFVGIAAAKIGD